MASTKRWTVQSFGTKEPSPEMAVLAARKRGSRTFEWPADAEEHVFVSGIVDGPYMVDVEFARDAGGKLVPVSVAVRSSVPRKTRKEDDAYPLGEGAEPEPVRATVLKEIAFGRVLRAAQAAAASPEPTAGRHKRLASILSPRWSPHSPRDYKMLAAWSRSFERDNKIKSPAQEIARRTGAPVNRVYQWLWRARNRYGEET